MSAKGQTMGNAQSRREAREAQRKKNLRKWIAFGGAGAILLSGGALATYVANGNNQPSDPQAVPDSCETTQTVTVETTKYMAEVLSNIPVSEDDCIVIDADHTSSTAEIAQKIIDGKNAPNLWIPDSSTRAELALAGKAEILTKDDSLAKNPGVIVTKGNSQKFQTWNEALSNSVDVAMGDPQENSGAFISMINAAGEVSEGKASAEDLSNNTGLRAQTIGVEEPARTSEQLMEDVAEDKAQSAIVTEADYSRYIKNHEDSDISAYVPATGTNELDFPMYQPTIGNGTNKTVDIAAAKISDYLNSVEGKQLLIDRGIRPEDGSELSRGSVGSVKMLSSEDPKVTASMWTSYSLQSAPMNALVAIDASGSMSTVIGDEGKTRMDITMEAVSAGAQLFPARDSMGLWSFASDIDEKDSKKYDYKELVPIRNFEADVDGQTQRELLLSKGKSITPYKDSYTALNNTILAAFENVKSNYEPGSANIVVVLTDGEDTDKDGISQDDLIAQIQEQQDPDNPVYFVFVGISEEANMDNLQTIAGQIGGEAFSASSAADIQKVFQEALSVSPDDQAKTEAQG